MASVWMGNIPGTWSGYQVVEYLKSNYGMAAPRDIRTNSNETSARRNQQYCVIDFSDEADAAEMLNKKGMVWPTGMFILVREARHRPKPPKGCWRSMQKSRSPHRALCHVDGNYIACEQTMQCKTCELWLNTMAQMTANYNASMQHGGRLW